MSIQKITAEIEKQVLSSQLVLANNPAMFRELLERQPVIQDLLESLKDPASVKYLLARVDLLLRAQDDVRYRNKKDAAIAVYVWALNQLNSAYGRLAASLVLWSPRLWWARKTALEALGTNPPPTTSQTTGTNSVPADMWSASTSSSDEQTIILPEPARELVREQRVVDPSSVTVQGSGDSKTIDRTEVEVVNSTPSLVNKA